MNLSVVKQFLSEVKVHLSGLNSIYPHKMNLSVVKQHLSEVKVHLSEVNSNLSA